MNIPPGTDPSNVDPTGTPPAHGANSGSHGDPSPTSTPTLEELQRQFADLQATHTKVLTDNQKYRQKKQEQEAADEAKKALDKAAEEKLLQEQNQHKELAEKRKAEIDKLQAEIAQRDSEIAKRDYEALRAKVATKHNLAPELSMRLVGTTEDELDIDAAALKKITGESQKGAPGNGPNPKPAGAPSIEQREKDETERLRRSGRYGTIG
ncbi:MAG TPA: hypothetical protein VHV10_21240 [Ktedonobacteraceae bacterium]|nr:hypothetical protein [Ktedonobacteraceae bacterium]